MMNYTGLYTPYKLNRPLTENEKNGQFCQGKRRRVNAIMDEASVIRMNSTFLETVCKYYSGVGISSSIIGIVCIFMFSFSILIVLGTCRNIYHGNTSDWGSNSFFIFAFLIPGCFFSKLLLKEWFRKTHYPIRFNRKNQMVYVYQVNGEVLSVPWNKIFFTSASSKGAMPEWGIDGHLLADDGETVVNTFSLAVSVMGSKKLLNEYWEFIRCYMEEACVEDLAEMVTLCPPVENRKEGYIFGLQYLLKMDSRLEWIFLPLMLPLDFLASLSRYIAMQTSTIPQWPQEVLEACQPAPDDPINISAASNPAHLWRYVLANEKREEYEARYARQAAAYARIKAKLAARYEKSGA
ncbi:hypothetical protein ACI0Z1_002234 [Cronobacter malonaticus]